MTDDVSPPGLRERKRLATRRAIQVSVLRLVRQLGYDAVTVEMISRDADVSARTFFNYFASKEEAIIGDAPEIPQGEALDRFLSQGAADRLLVSGPGASTGTLLPDLVDLLEASTQISITDRELVLYRRDVLREHPERFARRLASMHEFEAQLRDVLARRLALENPRLAADASALDSRARLAALVTMAALRHAWSEWVDPPRGADSGAVESGALESGDRLTETSLRQHLESSFISLAGLWSREPSDIG